jgi:hypothetical protein
MSSSSPRAWLELYRRHERVPVLNDRADRSPSEVPAPVFSFQLLGENLLQALTREIFRHNGVGFPVGQRRWLLLWRNQ